MNINTILALPRSVIFNLRHLPLKQAVKLPILIGSGVSTKIADRKESIIINAPLTKGMIQIGLTNGSFAQGRGARSLLRIAKGGKLQFNGSSRIEKGLVMCISERASIHIGDNIHMNAFTILNSESKVTIGNNVQFGWHCTIIDADGHDVINIENGEVVNKPRPITISDNSWLGAHTTITKGVTLAHHTIVPYGSIITKSNDTPLSVFGGMPNRVLKEGVARRDKYEQMKSIK